MYYIALDGEKLLGYCKYHKERDCVVVEKIQDGGNLDLFDGLLRAVFAYVVEAMSTGQSCRTPSIKRSCRPLWYRWTDKIA